MYECPLEIFFIFPVSVQSSSYEYNKGWLLFAFWADMRVVKDIHCWAIKTIRKYLSWKAIFFPEGLRIKKNYFT
jgi:hypothetical protein